MGKLHAENVRRLVPEARLIAVADVAAQRARQVADALEIEHSYASLEEIVQRDDIDAVLIATPDRFHTQAIRIAAAAGKDILCEKQLATNLEDASQIEIMDAVAIEEHSIGVGLDGNPFFFQNS